MDAYYLGHDDSEIDQKCAAIINKFRNADLKPDHLLHFLLDQNVHLSVRQNIAHTLISMLPHGSSHRENTAQSTHQNYMNILSIRNETYVAASPQIVHPDQNQNHHHHQQQNLGLNLHLPLHHPTYASESSNSSNKPGATDSSLYRDHAVLAHTTSNNAFPQLEHASCPGPTKSLHTSTSTSDPSTRIPFIDQHKNNNDNNDNNDNNKYVATSLPAIVPTEQTPPFYGFQTTPQQQGLSGLESGSTAASSVNTRTSRQHVPVMQQQFQKLSLSAYGSGADESIPCHHRKQHQPGAFSANDTSGSVSQQGPSTVSAAVPQALQNMGLQQGLPMQSDGLTPLTAYSPANAATRGNDMSCAQAQAQAQAHPYPQTHSQAHSQEHPQEHPQTPHIQAHIQAYPHSYTQPQPQPHPHSQPNPHVHLQALHASTVLHHTQNTSGLHPTTNVNASPSLHHYPSHRPIHLVVPPSSAHDVHHTDIGYGSFLSENQLIQQQHQQHLYLNRLAPPPANPNNQINTKPKIQKHRRRIDPVPISHTVHLKDHSQSSPFSKNYNQNFPVLRKIEQDKNIKHVPAEKHFQNDEIKRSTKEKISTSTNALDSFFPCTPTQSTPAAANQSDSPSPFNANIEYQAQIYATILCSCSLPNLVAELSHIFDLLADQNQYLAAYAQATIAHLHHVITCFPSKIINTMKANDTLCLRLALFPNPIRPLLVSQTDNAPNNYLEHPTYHDSAELRFSWCLEVPSIFSLQTKKVNHTFEKIWDKFIVLYRQWCGDIKGIPPGVLYSSMVSDIISAIASSDYQEFADRLLKHLALVCQPFAITESEDAITKNFQTDRSRVEKLHARMMSSTTTHRRKGGDRSSAPHKAQDTNKPPKNSAEIHIPDYVRAQFITGPEMFYMEFFWILDSALLLSFLKNKLSLAVDEAWSEIIIKSMSSAQFTEGILKTRLAVKYLSLLLSRSHATYSLSTKSDIRIYTENLKVHLVDGSLLAYIKLDQYLMDIFKVGNESNRASSIFALVSLLIPVMHIFNFDAAHTQAKWCSRSMDFLGEVYAYTQSRMIRKEIISWGIFCSYVLAQDYYATFSIEPRKSSEYKCDFSINVRNDDSSIKINDLWLFKYIIPSIEQFHRSLHTVSSSQNNESVKIAQPSRKIKPLRHEGNNSGGISSFNGNADKTNQIRPTDEEVELKAVYHALYEKQNPRLFELVKLSVETALRGVSMNDCERTEEETQSKIKLVEERARNLVHECVGRLLPDVETTILRVAAADAGQRAREQVQWLIKNEAASGNADMIHKDGEEIDKYQNKSKISGDEKNAGKPLGDKESKAKMKVDTQVMISSSLEMKTEADERDTDDRSGENLALIMEMVEKLKSSTSSEREEGKKLRARLRNRDLEIHFLEDS